jgi:glutaminyl-tRNA synthetase
VVDLALLEHCVRDVLNRTAPRAFGVLRPLKVVVENYPEDRIETFEVPVNPEDPAAGVRAVEFSRELWIEEDDFREEPPPRYWRLFPGNEVRLRGAYLVRCTGVARDGSGRVVAVRCTYDPQSRGGNAPDGRKVKSTIHWASAAHAVDAEVRLYDHLFTWRDLLSPDSEQILTGCKLESSLASARPDDRIQFERVGYFAVDRDSAPGRLIFNRIVTLKDSWAKIARKQSEG